MEPIILAGLSLLPKIPAMWNAVAKLFGKRPPQKLVEAEELAQEVIGLCKSGKVSPTTQLQLEKIINDHQAQMAMIALEKEKLFYGELQGVRELEIASYASGDQFIARTRPLILRWMFFLCLGFAILAPLSVVLMGVCKVSSTIILPLIDFLKWLGGFIFSIFASSYLGYSAARSLDKHNPNFKESDNVLGKALKNILGQGQSTISK